MGQSWKQILYKHEGKGDAICQLVAEHGVSYDALNARNPFVDSTTPNLPIARSEWVYSTPPVIRNYYARPIIGTKTVLRKTIEVDGVKRTVLALRKGRYDTNATAKAKLLVSRRFTFETAGVPTVTVDAYLSNFPTISAQPEHNVDGTFKITAEGFDLAALVASYQASGYLGSTPYGIEFLDDNTLICWGYYVSNGDWVYDLLCLLDGKGELVDPTSYGGCGPFWVGRYADEDGRIRVVNYYASATKNPAVLHPWTGATVTVQGFQSSIINQISEVNFELVVEASDPIYRVMPREMKEQIQVVIDLYGVYSGVTSVPSSFTLGDIVFNRVSDGNTPFGTHYRATTNAWVALGDDVKRVYYISYSNDTVPYPIGVQTTIDGLINLDGVAVKDPQAWRDHLMNME